MAINFSYWHLVLETDCRKSIFPQIDLLNLLSIWTGFQRVCFYWVAKGKLLHSVTISSYDNRTHYISLLTYQYCNVLCITVLFCAVIYSDILSSSRF